MALLAHAPRLPTVDAERLARELYGVTGTASPLTSERDQNFLLTAHDGGRFVLKIANASEDRGLLNAQGLAMARVAERTDLAQRVIPSRSGQALTQTPDQAHFVRLVTWIPGVPAGSVHYHSAAYRQDLGRCIGCIGKALGDFDHPAAHRTFYWDLAHGFMVCHERIASVRDKKLRALVARVLGQTERDLEPVLAKLPTSVVHNDANDFNIIVREDGDPYERRQRVAGIVDFGDMVHSWTVGDLAIAATYASIRERDPLLAMADVARGYNGERPLDDAELTALFGLVRLRMCTSICVAATQTRERPGDAYLSVSQDAMARALPMVAAINPRLAEVTFRVACGVVGSPDAIAVSRHLERLASRRTTHASGIKPILGRKLDARTTMPIPLDVSSALVSADPAQTSEPITTERIFATMRSAGASVTFGGYAEPRLMYHAPAFADPVAAPGERRTVHLGVDLFAEAGTPVHAPIAGTVHAAAHNKDPQDYGHVIVLKHEVAGRVTSHESPVTFYTLYGHLSAKSLKGMKPGRRVRAGERIGWFGVPRENGGWTPHVHVQLFVDDLELGTDFPGVARPSMKDAWLALCPDPTPLLGLPKERFPAPTPDKAETLAERRKRLAGNLSVAYRDPVKITRGWMQYLYDDGGRRYVDAYNNVPHVGHAHPRIVAAAATQMSLVNTNTRYLHDTVNQFAAELCQTLPAPLTKVFFVNSGSEANELALRLARAHTGHRDLMVLHAAYHGITTTLIDASPYKHYGPGGDGPPPWVHGVPVPDDYRGPHKRADPGAGEKYADDVRMEITHLHNTGKRLCAYIAESLPSVGGQIVFPQGYLAAAYRHVRAAGGVCIADEVQTGYGRIGTHFWGFQQQGVVPDIVVLGKPIGNGYPIGAVITTPDIAASFDNGMEFFSTFGGSTVSAAVGLEVLRVTREEKLMEHARRVGGRMLRGLKPIADRCSLVGDVRGSGLFLGVELVRDKQTLEPAAEEASYVVNRMREAGILLGTDGPYHNVLKIRPPMPFNTSDADTLVATLGDVLLEL